MELFQANGAVAAQLPALENAVRANQITPFAAARTLLSSFTQKEP